MATPKVITAARLPIHSQLSLSSHFPKKAAKLNANRGKKTRKPTDAAKPIPKKILITVSEVIVQDLMLGAGLMFSFKSFINNPASSQGF